jgi:hypothetical protein
VAEADHPFRSSQLNKLITDALGASAEWRKRQADLLTKAQSIAIDSELMRQATISVDNAQKIVAETRKHPAIGRLALDGSANRLALEIGRETQARQPILGVDLADLSGRVAAMIESMDRPTATWRKALLQRIEEFPSYQPMLKQMQEATNAFMKSQRSLDERADEFVARQGWPIPLRLNPRLFGRIVGHADAPKRDVNAMMVETFRPGTRAYNLTRDVLLESPHLESRTVLLKQAMKAFRREEWYLVINALLPLVEGVLVDAVFVYANAEAPKKGRPEKSVKQLQKVDAEIFYPPLVRGLEVMLIPSGAGVALFSGFDFSDYGRLGEPRNLNRHAILHGAARRYGSRQNALKLYLLLVMLAELLVQYEEIRRQEARRRAAKKG